jgi:hypothetical protein
MDTHQQELAQPAPASIDLTDEDLRPDTVGRSLDFQQTLPLGLLDMALAAGQPDLERLDAALKGRHTAAAKEKLAQFRNQVAKELSTLTGRKKAVDAELANLKARIESIDKAARPIMPEGPNLSNASEQQKKFLMQQHAQKLTDYQAAHAKYQADQNSLGALRGQARTFEREAAQLASTIANHKVQAEADERAFLRDVSETRDKDLLIELDRTLERSRPAFHSEANPFKGFWTLLGAACLLDLFDRVFSQPSAASEAARRFSQNADALAQSIEDAHAEIVTQSLAGPALIHRALAANREALAALAQRLAELPSSSLQERRDRARRLLEQSLPAIPEYRHLEKPQDLEDMKARLIAMHASTESHIASVRGEIDGEPADVRRAVNSAQADAAATIGKIGDLGASHGEALRRTRILWTLIQRADGSAQPSAAARRLCAALPQEFIRRFDVPVDAVLAQATASNFGLDDAHALMRTHLLTDYVATGEKMQRRLADSQGRLSEIAAAMKDIDTQDEKVAGKYRQQLIFVSLLSVFPGIGLGAAIWASGIINRLKPLVTSNKAAYVRLGDFAFVALAWAVALSGASAAVMGAITALNSVDLLDMSFGIAAALSNAVCLASFALCIRNLLKVRAYLQERTQLLPAPAT